jgi:ABC-2 type transport system permease protein
VIYGTVAAPYGAALSARYRMLLQYRAAALAGAGTQFFWGFIRIMILLAFYRSGSGSPPMAFADVVTYIWLGQAFLALLPWNHDLELERQIREGGVAYELLRPVDLYAFWSMRTLATRIASTSLRAIPILLVAGVILPLTGLSDWGLAPPDSLASAALFAVAMFVAIGLGCAITMLVHVSLLWTISGDGMARLIPSLVTVFSGMVIPLPLFPAWSQPILDLLPFRGLVDVPFRIYSGDIPVGEAMAPILLCTIWWWLLVAVGRALLARGQRALVVLGG